MCGSLTNFGGKIMKFRWAPLEKNQKSAIIGTSIAYIWLSEIVGIAPLEQKQARETFPAVMQQTFRNHSNRMYFFS